MRLFTGGQPVTVHRQQALQFVEAQPVAVDQRPGQHQRVRVIAQRARQAQQLRAQPPRVFEGGVTGQGVNGGQVVQGAQRDHALRVSGRLVGGGRVRIGHLRHSLDGGQHVLGEGQQGVEAGIAVGQVVHNEQGVLVQLRGQSPPATGGVRLGEHVRQVERQGERLVEAIRVIEPPDAAEALAGALVNGDSRQQGGLARARLTAHLHRAARKQRAQHARDLVGAPFKDARARRRLEPGARRLDDCRDGARVPARGQWRQRRFGARLRPVQAEGGRVEPFLALLDGNSQQRLSQGKEFVGAKAGQRRREFGHDQRWARVCDHALEL